MEETPSAPFFRSILPESDPAALFPDEAASGTPLMPESFRHKLWRGKWVVGFTAATFSLLAMMLGGLQQPLYRVQSSIEVQAPAGGNRGTNPADWAATRESFVQTQMRIIESRSLQERVLAKLSDAERARLLETPHFWWTSRNDQPVDSIQQRISVRAGGQLAEQSGIVDIALLSTDGTVGAHFLNVLTQELADFNVERTWRAVQHNRQWTEREIDDLRRKWEQSEQVLAEYLQVSGVRESVTNPALPVVAPQASGRVVAKDPKTRQLRVKLAELNKEIPQWQTLYGPSGATVLKLKAEAAQTQAAIQRARVLSVRPVQEAGSEPAASQAQDQAGPGKAAAHLMALQQEANSNKAIYESTANRLKEASVLMASQLGSISVVDPAVATSRLATPSQFAAGTLGAFMGSLLGMAFVVLREKLSHTFSEPVSVGQYLGLPVLGAIPVDRLGVNHKTYDAEKQEPGLHLNFETDLETAEAFRSLRSSILLGASQKAGPQRLVFTSASASEGTTFVIGNLGAALASAQRRVLLVDGNLRSPGLHKIFGADNERGLAELLSRQISADTISSRDVIRETQIPDLYLLSAGQAGTRAPEILSSAQLPILIREFAKGFDLVLVDSAPALPYADARSLARAVDGVVLVVKAGSTNRHKAMEAREAMSQDGSTIIGTILTDWDTALSASA